MAQKFESNGRMYDVEIFQHEDTDIVRFYEEHNTGQLFGLDGIKADNPIKAKQGSSDASNY